MRRILREILVFITASVIITLGTIVAGMKLTAPTPSAPVPVDLLSGTCLDEPFLQTQEIIVGALARLCFDVDAVRPRIELTGLPSGVVFSGWFSQTLRPSVTSRERCPVEDTGPNGPSPLPVRFDSAVTDQTGRVQLSATMPGLRIMGGSQTKLVVIDHGRVGPDRSAVRTDEVLTWDNAWVHGTTPTTGASHRRGRVVGCASFWLRGGVESVGQ